MSFLVNSAVCMADDDMLLDKGNITTRVTENVWEKGPKCTKYHPLCTEPYVHTWKKISLRIIVEILEKK
jgi:hypothetical protein